MNRSKYKIGQVLNISLPVVNKKIRFEIDVDVEAQVCGIECHHLNFDERKYFYTLFVKGSKDYLHLTEGALRQRELLRRVEWNNPTQKKINLNNEEESE